MDQESSPVSGPQPTLPQSIEPQEPQICGDCEQPKKKLWRCVQCIDLFCDECWLVQRPHKPGKILANGRPHEKVDDEVVHRLNQIFHQPSLEAQQARHNNDTHTTWFGIEKGINEPFLHSSMRLVDILYESQVGEFKERYPHLVSFVGQTGSGKSTVIRMLMDHAQANKADLPSHYQHLSPVPGLINDNLPTTGDVHLYADPGTYYDQRPILYADSEGMTGGESTPRGIEFRSKKGTETGKKRRIVKEKIIKKTLTWASDHKKSSREFAVKNLFPRILYTFSDVIVFVLREVRTFETEVLQLLVEWADASINKSVNQPRRPHVIIVLNAVEMTSDDNQWKSKYATEKLLHDYQDSVQRVRRLREIISTIKTSPPIETTEDLFKHYYTSITVLKIPHKGCYMQIDKQLMDLHKIISEKCAESYTFKKEIRMLLNAERLPRYVNAAYDHFTQDLNEPFDFVTEARRHLPPPQDFGGHVLNFILFMYDQLETSKISITGLFNRLASPIASCIMLAAMRDKTHGTFSSLLQDTYKTPLDDAISEFCYKWLRCSYKKEGVSCVNTQSSHEKGHQSNKGVIFARGSYKSPFQYPKSSEFWINEIQKSIKGLENTLHNANKDEGSIIPNTHREIMKTFYNAVPSASNFRSQLTCVCCIGKIPEYVLPCGHIICKECVQLFGDRKGQGLFNIHRCPIHPTNCQWKSPMQIEFKPEEAGVRILCLDGGGARGIIELAILREIEKALGDHIPIQNFFDLIVGTSAGGILALGLGVKNWRVADCTSYFKDFCKQAFTKRAPRMFNALNIMRGKGIYKSKTIESALESVFDSTSVLYGGVRHAEKRSIRVAVTTTLAREDRAAVLSNYNTERRSESLPYVFVRPQDPTREIKVWEAARATSAAPPYFKPFIHKKTMCAYTDGAIHHHCPVLIADQERRLLWEDVKDWAPDIVLSIGSGAKSTNEVPSSPETMSLSASDDFLGRTSKPQRTVAGLGYLWRTANKIIERQLDCEDTWRKYSNLNKSPKNRNAYGDDNRNIRLNVYFANQRPSFDDVESLEDMEQLGMFMAQENHDEIQNVVEKLIASCFYFEMLGPAFRNMQSQQYQCKGKIRCRFHNDPHDIQGLGNILLKYCTDTFSPSLLITENYGSDNEKQYIAPFPITIIEDMTQSSAFNSPEEIHIEANDPSSLTNISLYLHPENFGIPHEISGFPRDLCAVGGFVMPNPEISGENGEPENVQENGPEPEFTSEEKEAAWKLLNAERQSFHSEPGMGWTVLDIQETVRRAKSVNGHRENESQVSFHNETP